MSDFDFPASDDLSATLAAPARTALPQDEQLARIRSLGDATPMVACPRCAGTGHTRWGVCFKCNGKAKIKGFKTAAPVRAANRAKAAERKERTMNANWTTFVELHPAEAEVLTKGIAQTFGDGRWNAICADIKGKVEKYGDLHQGTMDMLGRAVARAAERAAQKATVVQQAASVSYPNIRAALEAVRAKGAKRASATVGDVDLSLAPMTGKNPGALYVKWNGEYAGKIVGVTFQARNDSPELRAALALIEADPTAAIKAQAATNAQKIAAAVARGEEPQVPCGCCGILLTDPVSRARGIGPICADKWGF